MEFYCWLDLEMSGLNAEKDCILELSYIVTNTALQQIAPEKTFVFRYDTIPSMSEYVHDMHTKSGLLSRILVDGIDKETIEYECITDLKQYAKTATLYLAGNTIYQDRSFLSRYLPQLNQLFHYRMIDVSSLKILINAWYPHNQNRIFEKQKNHRAALDIQESIAELIHYKNYFFK